MRRAARDGVGFVIIKRTSLAFIGQKQRSIFFTMRGKMNAEIGGMDDEERQRRCGKEWERQLGIMAAKDMVRAERHGRREAETMAARHYLPGSCCLSRQDVGDRDDDAVRSGILWCSARLFAALGDPCAWRYHGRCAVIARTG